MYKIIYDKMEYIAHRAQCTSFYHILFYTFYNIILLPILNLAPLGAIRAYMYVIAMAVFMRAYVLCVWYVFS